ncbi:hypothetical protein [Hyphococcus sp.]|uniref:hypothetical protein n=1 Tax=Hyphococcus sp. TaxID=2038636 RepID=UPI003CCB8CBC
MGQQRAGKIRHGKLFGTADTPATPRRGQSLAEQLSQRLSEKYTNYERAAARLELRGEHDAAIVLRRAAGRLRLIRNGDKAASDKPN